MLGDATNVLPALLLQLQGQFSFQGGCNKSIGNDSSFKIYLHGHKHLKISNSDFNKFT
jgi:hypothetical protein